MTEQTGQRGEVETGTSSAGDSRAESSQDEADEMAGPNEQSGYEGDSGSSSGGSGSSGSDDESQDSGSSGESDSGSSGGSSSGGGSSTATRQRQDQQQDQGQNQQQDQDQQQEQDQQQDQQQDQGQGQDQQQEDQQHDHGEDGSGPRGRSSRAPLNVGDLLWKVCNVLATVVRVVGYVLAAVLVAYIVLAFIGANTANGVAQVIGSVAEVAVLAFRDLFVIGDPVFAVVVNYGLAAIFWILVAEFGSRLVRWLGARLS